MKNKILTIAGAAILSAASTAPAFAHESRGVLADDGTSYFRLTVGFHIEPAFEDTDGQGIDVFINAWDGRDPAVNDLITASVNRKAGDTVNLKVTALYLDTDAPLGQSTILRSLLIADDFDADPDNNTRLPFGETNIYEVLHRTTHPGAYGYHFEGDVNFLGRDADPVCLDAACSVTSTPFVAARSAHIDEFFICGNGHGTAPDPFNGTPNTSKFNCVQVLPPFPGKVGDGYKPNKPLVPRD
ncbi:MAG: hypothetical protein ACRERU_15455 [Methylococcales bacterium]